MKKNDSFADAYTELIGILEKSIDDVNAVKNTDIAHLKIKITNSIKMDVNMLKTRIGQPTNVNRVPATQGLKKIFGKEVVVSIDPVQKSHADKQEEIEIKEEQAKATDFRREVKELLDKFNTMSSEEILTKYNDMQVRGVGMIAGLPVTEKSPKVINVQFIEQIREALRLKKEVDDSKNK